MTSAPVGLRVVHPLNQPVGGPPRPGTFLSFSSVSLRSSVLPGGWLTVVLSQVVMIRLAAPASAPALNVESASAAKASRSVTMETTVKVGLQEPTWVHTE